MKKKNKETKKAYKSNVVLSSGSRYRDRFYSKLFEVCNSENKITVEEKLFVLKMLKYELQKGGNWMPVITYKCPKCHQSFTQILNVYQQPDPTAVCVRCGHVGLIVVTTHKPRPRKYDYKQRREYERSNRWWWRRYGN